jgi:type II secretory pathway pseudopilin PulG
MTVVRKLRTALARLRSERGYTLAELLVGMATMSFVLLALMGLLDSVVQTAPREEERANAIREGQTGLHIMTRELRQANKVWTPGRTQIYINVGDDRHVLYDCDVVDPANSAYRQCRRWSAAIGSELPLNQPGSVVVSRRLPGDVFTYEPNLVNPTYVKVALKVPQSGERKGGYQASLVLDDGFYLRNTDVG